MSTYTQILYQLVFATKKREKTMIEQGQRKLYKYLYGILKQKNCYTYRINGTEDHLHIILSLHPGLALANLVKDLKLKSWDLIKEENIFPDFSGWAVGYGAFTYSIEAKDNLIEYVKNQKIHHAKNTFMHEYMSLLNEHHIEYTEKHLLM